MNIKRNALGAAVALAMVAPMSASAGVIAQAVLQVTDFTFTGSVDGQLDVSDFTVLVFDDSTDANVSLGAASASDSDSTTNFAGLDLAQQCVGACSFGENDYSPHLSPTENTARGDTLLNGSPLTGAGAPVGANAYTLAEAQIAAGDLIGSSESNLGLIASFSFSLVHEQAVTISFDSDLWLRTLLTLDAIVPGSSAQARSSWSIAIDESESGVSILDWTPNGSVDEAFETADGCDLTQTIASQIPGTSATRDCSGSHSATTAVLTAGTLYTLNLAHETTADATNVPAPGTLALAGLGLLGAGAARRRSKA